MAFPPLAPSSGTPPSVAMDGARPQGALREQGAQGLGPVEGAPPSSSPVSSSPSSSSPSTASVETLGPALALIQQPALVMEPGGVVTYANGPALVLFHPSLRARVQGAELDQALTESLHLGWYPDAPGSQIFAATAAALLTPEAEPSLTLGLANGQSWRLRPSRLPCGLTLLLGEAQEGDVLVGEPRLQDEIQALRQQIHRSQKLEAVGRMAGAIAQEFSAILANIHGYATFLTEDLEQDSELQDYARQIEQSCSKAGRVISRILPFAHRRAADHSVTNLAHVTQQVLGELCHNLRADVVVRATVQEEDALVQAEPEPLREAILALLANACGALTSAGHLTVSLDTIVLKPGQGVDLPQPPLGAHRHGTAYVESLPSGQCRLWLGQVPRLGQWVRLRIRDNGVGMTRPVMDRILAPLSNMGLGGLSQTGLTGVQGTILAHDGSLIIDSRPGQGTEVTVVLPAAKSAALADDRTEGLPDRLRGDERILLVDDDKQALVTLTQALVSMGYRVRGVRHGLDAAEALERTPDAYDLMLADYAPPTLGGFDLLRYTKRRHPHLLLLLMVAQEDAGGPEQAQQTPMVTRLRKPMTHLGLLQAVRRTLDRVGSAEESPPPASGA